MFFKDKLVLAPLTKGGNLPFRRLCASFNADITTSEMAYARFVARGDRREQALLRAHPSEQCFGVQFAVLKPEEAIAASKIAVEKGAQFIDINCGCPIEDTTRRGLGAAMLRKPNAIAHLVKALAEAVPVPVTVKIRLGWNQDDIVAPSLAQKVEEAGAAAITVHGRTRDQRYSRAADWLAIAEIKKLVSIPVIGNGDIATHYEAEDKKALSNVDSLMLGRGVLIKPWLFSEIKEGTTWNLSSEDRTRIYFQLAQYMKEHFGSDEKGVKRIMQFLPWHCSFFCRYLYLPKDRYHTLSQEHPLLQTRVNTQESDDPLDRVLSSTSETAHKALAQLLISETESSLPNAIRNTPLPSNPQIQDDTFMEAQG